VILFFAYFFLLRGYRFLWFLNFYDPEVPVCSVNQYPIPISVLHAH